MASRVRKKNESKQAGTARLQLRSLGQAELVQPQGPKRPPAEPPPITGGWSESRASRRRRGVQPALRRGGRPAAPRGTTRQALLPLPPGQITALVLYFFFFLLFCLCVWNTNKKAKTGRAGGGRRRVHGHGGQAAWYACGGRRRRLTRVNTAICARRAHRPSISTVCDLSVQYSVIKFSGRTGPDTFLCVSFFWFVCRVCGRRGRRCRPGAQTCHCCCRLLVPLEAAPARAQRPRRHSGRHVTDTRSVGMCVCFGWRDGCHWPARGRRVRGHGVPARAVRLPAVCTGSAQFAGCCGWRCRGAAGTVAPPLGIVRCCCKWAWQPACLDIDESWRRGMMMTLVGVRK